MPSFIQLLTLVCSALLFGSAVAQRPRPTPACLRSDTKDLAKLEQCIKTTVFAIESVTNADGDFTEACDEIKYAEASSQNLDVYFLRVLICGSFGGQGVFYDNSDDAIAELSYARVALRIAEDSSTDPVLRLICPELDLQTLYDFGLPAGNIYNAACGDVYISSPPSYTSSASTASTTSSSSSSDVSISAYDPSSTDSGSSTGTTPASPISPSSYTGPPTPSDSLISSTYPPSTTPPPPYTGDTTSSFSSSTSCTTTSTSIPVHMYRRVNSLNQTYDYWTELLKSAIFALDLIETNDDDTRCDESDIWIDAFNRLGYDGEYVESML